MGDDADASKDPGVMNGCYNNRDHEGKKYGWEKYCKM